MHGAGTNLDVVTEGGSCRVAIVTKGHPFDAPAFFAVFDSMDGIEWTHVEHPDALGLVEPATAAEFDVFVMYDMPGITFTRGDPPAEFPDPPSGYIEAFQRLLDEGKGMVFLHHAIAGWPAWEGYADIVGGRFHYQPATLDGIDYPDSGYRHDVTHTIEVVDPTHPICDGIDASFALTDEVYLFPVLEDRVRPLMRSTLRVRRHELLLGRPGHSRHAQRPHRLAPPTRKQPRGVDEDRRHVADRVPAIRRRTGHLRRSELPPHPVQRHPLGR